MVVTGRHNRYTFTITALASCFGVDENRGDVTTVNRQYTQ